MWRSIWKSLGRSGLIAIMCALCLSMIASAGMAQDPPPGSQPAPPPGDVLPGSQGDASLPEPPIVTLPMPDTMDLGYFCQNGVQQSPVQSNTQGAGASLAPGTTLTSYNLLDGRMAVSANLQLSPAAFVSMYGPSAWLQVNEGAVAIVACAGSLVFDLSQGDNTQFELPAGTGLVLDSAFADGIFLTLDEMSDWAYIVQLGDGATSTITLDVEVGQWAELICDQDGCLTTNDIDNREGSFDGTTIGGGPCAMVRCWGK